MKKLLPKTVNNPSGFTLVELLVVITIIAILSVVGVTVFGGVQSKARDARRKADVDSISKALEVNFNVAKDGKYPAVDGNWFSSGTIPSNPSPGGANYSYPAAAATTYTVKALLENGGGNCKTTADNDSYCKSNQQ